MSSNPGNTGNLSVISSIEIKTYTITVNSSPPINPINHTLTIADNTDNTDKMVLRKQCRLTTPESLDLRNGMQLVVYTQPLQFQSTQGNGTLVIKTELPQTAIEYMIPKDHEIVLISSTGTGTGTVIKDRKVLGCIVPLPLPLPLPKSLKELSRDEVVANIYEMLRFYSLSKGGRRIKRRSTKKRRTKRRKNYKRSRRYQR
jgi:hypothetical protein